MSDEINDPIETPEAEVEETTPDPQADIEAERARLAEERATIERDRKALQKGFAEIAAKQRVMQQPTPMQPTYDPYEQLDPEQARLLQQAIEYTSKQAISPDLESINQFLLSTVSDQIDAVATSKGADPDEVRAVLAEYGIQPQGNSVAAVREATEKAVSIIQARSFDPEAEKKRITEQVLADLAEKGVQVEAVRPTRTAVGTDAEPDWDDPTYSELDRYNWMKAHGR